METIALGTQGLKVSRQGLGCMGMSDFYGPGTTPSRSPPSTAPSTSGSTFFDTSDMYGPHTNEVLVGRALAGRRDEAVIATKFGIVRDPDDPAKRAVNGRPEYVRQACDGSLSRLGVDHIDLYYQHRVDPDTPIEETVGAMAELVTAGQGALPRPLRGGAGHHPAGPRRAPDLGAADRVLGLVARPGGGDPAHACASSASASSPTARSAAASSPAPCARSTTWTRATSAATSPASRGTTWPTTSPSSRSSTSWPRPRAARPGQVALAFVHAAGRDVAPIPGTKRRSYLEENVGALDVELTEEDLAVLDTVAPAKGDRYADMSPVNR